MAKYTISELEEMLIEAREENAPKRTELELQIEELCSASDIEEQFFYSDDVCHLLTKNIFITKIK